MWVHHRMSRPALRDAGFTSALRAADDSVEVYRTVLLDGDLTLESIACVM